MGSVISTLKVKKQSIKRLTFNNKNKLLIKPFEEDYDSEDSIDRLSVEDFNKEDEDQDHGVCKLKQKGQKRREEYGTCQVYSDPENRPATDVILRDIVNWKDIIHSDDIEELSEEQLKIRKEFEEADKHIPDIATNAYKNMHPNTVWKSQYLKLPKLPDSQKNEYLDDIILFESEEPQESHKNHDTVKVQS
ncbi:hypothetical protein F8M41_004630 [Gigaspora margarita]|uniref:Uncharacterized protein n=1 Tax=Gigaspora margarita TaxID=4874 RepID=A0A8H3XAT6_GIGMA|nr:hypothetical protein F8M41_004630 [Gigaspora margarita]